MSVTDRVYARALFDAVLEKDRLEPVRDQLAQVVAAEAEVPELRELLRNPQLDPRARAAALEDLLAGGEELLRNFLLVLVDKGRTGQLEEIIFYDHPSVERRVHTAMEWKAAHPEPPTP